LGVPSLERPVCFCFSAARRTVMNSLVDQVRAAEKQPFSEMIWLTLCSVVIRIKLRIWKSGNRKKEIMKPVLRRTLSICSSASLLLCGGAIPSAACGPGETKITNLPPFTGSSYQVYGLNSQGQVTGYLFISGVHGPHAFIYSDTGLVDLGTLGGGGSVGYGINSSGQVVGQASLSSPGQSHAFAYSNGSMTDLGTLGGLTSLAEANNDAGLVVGQSDLSAGAGSAAFMYANGVMSNLGTLGGTYGSAFAVNNSGLVVGESTLASGDTHGFSWTNGPMTDLGTLGGNYSSAFAVSPDGVIVGESSVASGDTHAFVLIGGSMMDLGTFGGVYSSAFAVNTNDVVVGNSDLEGDQNEHGFVFANGTLTDIGTLGGLNSDVWAVNNLGQVVGNSDLADGSTHAFIWATNNMVDLNTLLPTNSGWVLKNAQFISDAGRIVGMGTYNGSSQWFVMDLGKGNQPPIANAGVDQTVDCQAQANLDGSGSSDPDNDSLSYQWIAGGNVIGTNVTLSAGFPIGTNVVTLRVSDSCGAFSDASVVVTVVDTTAPTGSCPNAATASTDNNCQAAVPNLVPQVVATDNCTPTGSLVITQDPAAGTMVGPGVHQIALTVTDSSGNHSTCKVPFTVSDTTAPAIVSTPGPITVSAGADCQAAVPNVLPNVVATDNCTATGEIVLAQNPAAGALLNSGLYTIVVTATDGSGNSSAANIPLKIADTTAPTFSTVPGPITLSAGDDCQAIVPNVLSGVVASDNCTPSDQIVMTQTPSAGDLVGSGDSTIVVTAVDASGNSTSVNIAVKVVDTTAPTLSNVPLAVTRWTGANCLAELPNLLPGIVATDNCTPANQLLISQAPAGGTLIGPGNYTLTITATDLAGNTTSTNVPVTIINTNMPVVQAISVSPNVLSPPNHALIPVTVSVLLSSGCSSQLTSKIVSITSNEAVSAGEIQITGNLTALLAASRNGGGGGRVYTITVQSTDASGNSSSAVVTVVVPQGNGNGGTVAPAAHKNK
jgi:probable HAF family extracellular repeat protein